LSEILFFADFIGNICTWLLFFANIPQAK